MEEGKRQRQVGKLIMEEMTSIFQREGFNIINSGLVSISKVSVTPDLLEARIYLSMFNIDDPDAMIHTIKEKTNELRKQLGARVKNQLRRIPEIHFFIDDTLDYVFKMETLFKKINEERDPNQETTTDA